VVGFELSNNVCICGTGEAANFQSQICSSCIDSISQCVTCSDSHTCTQCATGFTVLLGGASCTIRCGDGQLNEYFE